MSKNSIEKWVYSTDKERQIALNVEKDVQSHLLIKCKWKLQWDVNITFHLSDGQKYKCLTPYFVNKAVKKQALLYIVNVRGTK